MPFARNVPKVALFEVSTVNPCCGEELELVFGTEVRFCCAVVDAAIVAFG